MKKSIISMTVALAMSAAWTGGATAADPYPSKSIRFLVGYATGGGTDTMARTVAAKLTDSLGQQVIVDNRPGANANLAAGIAARATPDGYIVMFISVSHAISKSLYKKLDYDLQLSDVQQRLASLGADPLGGTAKSFGDYITTEIAKYEKVVREGKLQQQ